MECDRCGRWCHWQAGGWWCWFCQRHASLPRDKRTKSDDALRKGLNPYEWHRLSAPAKDAG